MNEQRDKEVKLKLYSRYEVQEYWIVNWQLKTLEVYRRAKPSFSWSVRSWLTTRYRVRCCQALILP